MAAPNKLAAALLAQQSAQQGKGLLDTGQALVGGFTGLGERPSVMSGNADTYDNAELGGILSNFLPGKAAAAAVGGKLAAALKGGLVGSKLAALPAMAGIFAGQGAKNANLAKMLLAEKSLAEGADPAQVWRETGWGRGPDQQMRWEIPDNAATIGSRVQQDKTIADISGRAQFDKIGGSPQLKDVLNHPKLYDSYPVAQDIGLDFEGNLGGSYSPDGGPMGSIRLGYEAKGPSTPLHELQHAIQQREGFARGGSPEQMGQMVLDARYNVDDLASKMQRGENAAGQEADLWLSKYPDKVKEAEDYLRSQNLLEPGEKADRQAIAFAITDQDRAHQSMLNRWRESSQMAKQSPTNMYHRLAGEAESRLTQSRMKLTPEQRSAQYPWQPDYFQQATGVPLDSLIYRYK